jgi:hypothetical protein
MNMEPLEKYAEHCEMAEEWERLVGECPEMRWGLVRRDLEFLRSVGVVWGVDLGGGVDEA